MGSAAGPATRRTAALLVTAALVGAATGCGTETGSGDGTGTGTGGKVTTITALDYYTDSTEHAQWGERLDACGRTAGVQVEHRSVPAPQLVPTVLRQASARTLPDLLMLDNPDVQRIAQTGALTPLEQYGIDTDGYTEGILAAGTHEDRLYGLAPAVNTVVLFYNKDMLDEAGVAVPRTWDELKKAAAELTRPGRYGLALDADPTFESSFQFLPFLWSNGGTETELDSPQAAQALQLWVDLLESGSMSKSVLTWNQADVHDRFAAGKAAMMVNGPWRIADLNKNKDLRWGMAPLPVRQEGQTLVTPLGGEMWTVPQTGSEARQEKAARVLACLNGPDNMLKVAGQYFTVPSRTTVAAEYAEQAPSMNALVDSVATARSRTGRLGARWPKAATGIYTAIQSALTGEETPEEALERAQRIATAGS